MKEITFIAQFPPPIHGLSKAVDTLYHSNISSKYILRAINLTNNKAFFKTFWRIIFSKSDLFYFTISQTKGGNLRDLLILKLLELKHAKCLIHLHGGYYRDLIDHHCGKIQRTLNYKAICRLSGCIVLGETLRSIFKGMIDESKIFIVPNCIDEIYVPSPNSIEDKLEKLESTSVINILYLSNFIESKGYKKVLELALMAKANKENNLHFHFAGCFFHNEDEKYFFHYIKQNGLESYISYHGVVTGIEKKILLQNCHIFILLTNYPNEGQPISILEALANGLFVITTNHAGIPDIVSNGINGIVVDKSYIKIDDIFSRIKSVIQDVDKLKKICYGNYEIAINNYTEKQYIANMDNIFKSIIQK